LQENVLWCFLIVFGSENNISKVGRNRTIRRGLNLTSKKDGCLCLKVPHICSTCYPINTAVFTHLCVKVSC
jgi:hypothetical protein